MPRVRGKKKHGAERILKNKFLKAQINPFSREAYGCKVPDFNTAPSSASFTFDQITPTTNLTNASCQLFLPFSSCLYATATNTVGADSWTWPAAYGGKSASSQETALIAQYGIYRPVAHGIRITCPKTMDTATGYVHVALYSPSCTTGTTWQLPTSVTHLSSCGYYRKISIQSLITKPVTIVNKFLDASAFQYADMAATISDAGTSLQYRQTFGGWCGILVAITGQPSGDTPIQIESIVHIEGQSLFSGQTRDGNAEPANMNLMEAVSETSGKVDPLFESPTGSTPPSRTSSWETNVLMALGEILDETLAGYEGDLPPIARAVYRGVKRYASKRTYSPPVYKKRKSSKKRVKRK